MVALLNRSQGATIAAIIAATGWPVRGFQAGVVRKKLGLTLQSEKTDGERVYRVIAGLDRSWRQSATRPHCERRPRRSACVTLKFASSHPGRSDSNFDVPGEDSAASSCTSVQSLSGAFATVGAAAKSTTSGSAEIQSRSTVLVIVIITLLPKFFSKRVGRALGEESDGGHLPWKN